MSRRCRHRNRRSSTRIALCRQSSESTAPPVPQGRIYHLFMTPRICSTRSSRNRQEGHAVHHRENRGVGADAERRGEDGRRGEVARAAQLTERVAKVLSEVPVVYRKPVQGAPCLVQGAWVHGAPGSRTVHRAPRHVHRHPAQCTVHGALCTGCQSTATSARSDMTCACATTTSGTSWSVRRYAS